MAIDNEVTFEITKELGVISTASTGWNRELNKVSWCGNPAKFDIRDWDPARMRMTRGLTFTEKEAKALLALLKAEFEK